MAEAALVTRELYGHSLSTICEMGRLAIHAIADTERYEAIMEAGRTDFATGVTEMLKTDNELREKLDIDNIKTYEIIDGRVCGIDGEPMVDKVRRGAEASAQRAQIEQAFGRQSVRDAQDVLIAEQADSLKVGETLFAQSLDPKEALRENPEVYKEELGYKEGLTYWQFYSRIDANTMAAGSLSVDMSDKSAWSDILAEHGLSVPFNESCDTWLTATAHKRIASPESAEQFIRGLRAEYYQRIGKPGQRLSVTEYVEAETNRQVVDAIFDNYYPNLGKAIVSGKNDEQLKAFANTVLQSDISDLSPEVRMQLIRIGSSKKFDAGAGRLMDSVLRYVATEQLRKGLKNLTAPNQNRVSIPNIVRMSVVFVPPDAMQLHHLLAANLRAGVEAGRSYGGCPGNIKLHINGEGDSLSATERILRKLQDAYSGLGDQEESEASSKTIDEDCEFVSKQCPLCEKKNVKTTVTKTEISGDCGCKVKRPMQAHSKLAA